MDGNKSGGIGLKEIANRIVEKLGKYFEKRDDIVMAFLFGSWAKGHEGTESDIDIAVYFKPESNILEWESTDSQYEGEREIWLEIETIVEKDVDLLVLNRADATVADSALRGHPIIIKDRNLYMDFLLRITFEAIDFRQWIDGYWTFKEQRRHGAATRR